MEKPRELISYPQIKEIWGIGYTRQHLKRLENNGRFPRRVKISTNAVRWVKDEINQHVAGWVNARDVTDA